MQKILSVKFKKKLRRDIIILSISVIKSMASNKTEIIFQHCMASISNAHHYNCMGE